ncbi:FMN-binding protein [Leifsonia sp. C5G2]|uniref:FMN-binding protein n=1 Tax=Leifsonia sp. C5G2 TaxID=2735269 RepID=UPI001585565D|nr:FMN-binding protein [Leifsonia sp. C5G2]NUU06503.1 FMN-binding protein [Leifsonia sp. C5G2]
MNSRSWRGTVLFTVILVVMGATVGLKLYGVGEQVAAAPAASTSTSTGSAGTSGTGTTTGSGSSTASGPAATATATPTPSPSASTATTTKTVTGSAVDTRYGVVQVKVTFSGTSITAVDTVQAPSGNGRDIEINQQALPMLEQEVLASQSANIDTVSGATYTSEGYIRSVQSAIDQR